MLTRKLIQGMFVSISTFVLIQFARYIHLLNRVFWRVNYLGFVIFDDKKGEDMYLFEMRYNQETFSPDEASILIHVISFLFTIINAYRFAVIFRSVKWLFLQCGDRHQLDGNVSLQLRIQWSKIVWHF